MNSFRKFILHVALFGFAMLLFSCSGNKQKPSDDVESGSDFLKNQAAPYDADAINPDAPVTEILVTASGNTMAEMKFDKDTLVVPANSTVKLTLKNSSVDMSMMHNFLLTDPSTVKTVADLALKAGKDKDFIPDHPSVYVSTKMTSPGEETSVSFPAPPAGLYKYICTYPGHYSIMQGWFIVQ